MLTFGAHARNEGYCRKIQKRDESFCSKHPRHFQTNTQKKGGASLLVNDSLTSEPSVVLPYWADHFSGLSKYVFHKSLSKHLHTPSTRSIVAKRPTFWGTIPQICPLSSSLAEEALLSHHFLTHCAIVALDLYPSIDWQPLWTVLTAVTTTGDAYLPTITYSA